MNAFASFIVAPASTGVAATTRAADRGEAGKIGLPGGKIDEGEAARDAAIREAAEEGWSVSGVSLYPIHTAMVEGEKVLWFSATKATPLNDYKEKGRISPVVATLSDVANSGYGNHFLKNFKLN